MKHQLVEGDDATIGVATHVCANPRGPALVILHGFGESTERWHGLAAELSRERHIYLLELPGHGRSQVSHPEGFDYDQQTSLLTTVAAKLGDGEPLHLLGYSMGGRLALGMALDRPGMWKSLTLVSAHPGLSTASERQSRLHTDAEWLALLRSGDMEAFANRWLTRGLFDELPPHIVHERAQGIAGQSAAGLRMALEGAGLGRQPDHKPHLSTLTVPTLLLAGEKDEKFIGLARTMHAAIPESRMEVIHGAGHAVHEGGADLTVCLGPWLRQHSETVPQTQE